MEKSRSGSDQRGGGGLNFTSTHPQLKKWLFIYMNRQRVTFRTASEVLTTPTISKKKSDPKTTLKQPNIYHLFSPF